MEFNDVRLQYEQLANEIDTAITQALTAGRYILGPSVETFEQEFARFCGVSAGVGVASGTDALRIGLAAIGVRAGDEVMVPALSAAATAMAVTQLRARPVFVDVRLDDFMMDTADADAKRTSRTKAIIPVHFAGMPARLKELSQLGAPIVEDAAQAHGSDASWGRCGSFGRAAAFSFYPTKNLGAYGDAGMLVTSEASLAERARMLRNYGERESQSSEMLGDNSRLDEIQAAILRVKLKRLEEWNRRRRAIAEAYRAGLNELPLAMQLETGKSNCHLFVIATPMRDALRQHLAAAGVPTLIHYPIPLPRHKAFAEFNPARCPNADQLSSRLLSLPMHAALADHEVDRVVSEIRAFFSAASRQKR
jgi:dTDP-4-amino-4,6-dideoxygalactose transaminase